MRALAPASATPLRFQRLHHALKGDVGVDEVETLLDTLHGDLLRTLERSPSAHTPGGVPQPPAFPAPSSAPSPSTSAYERAAAELLLLGTDATAQLLVDFECARQPRPSSPRPSPRLHTTATSGSLRPRPPPLLAGASRTTRRRPSAANLAWLAWRQLQHAWP